MSKTKRIAIYGKGGIGKSTTVANIAASFANDGKNVIVIGCDPKADTTRTLYGKRLPTILNTIKEKRNPELDEILFSGYAGVLCTESGGPEPGVGCAGRGVIVAMKLLDKLGAFENNFDVIIYDVLGDVVCGGFAVPLKEDYADEVYIVSSGEYMSLYAANNISKGIKKLKGNLSGIICNCKGTENEEKIVDSFAERIGSKVIGTIKRSQLIQSSELEAKTVVEKFPDSIETQDYEKLANSIWNNQFTSSLNPMDDEEFENFFKKFIV
ncbi:Ni-sirohydrochlorin a,c-diamide reductive cyclase ATP-dependent reductase subunit [Methanobrevibacter sp. TMH8]|uniref:Ni-sirohydrochlorin a,c-diamide reductive cyclase ATP-dependent reductase subunit n=1 Tax=Methanobrevibacter sp. TMH8 TaxID=2848611 RepID=UPI001CCF36FC|nr:Ni-sirohydrochlorin a,c-diamide reductive cyclase ATP-dependent reductase subunit [Methanobrevibacter sp. TMH8]MBZ9570512.1 Ni-sirohydrochlorin a,c-diamide reductive cyclase ATP-dependent reductase subunit [Methanobrevibacter sp. TMH8]